MGIIEALENRFELLEDIDQEKFKRKVIERVMAKIYKGGSRLKGPLQDGQITLTEIVKAIHNKRCVRTAEQDFGATYLEQILGTAIRDCIPINYINRARLLFGLDKLSPSELISHSSSPQPQRSS